jgi:myo-inositol-1(or 4)-monophosphatase
MKAAVSQVASTLERISDVVRRVAADEVMPRYLKVAHQRKSDGSLFTEADLAAQDKLSELLPTIISAPVVGEEMPPEVQTERWQAGEVDGLWCVDPIDGTSNFVHGLPYFALSVAFMRQGRSVMGVVYDPVADEMFCAEKGEGSFLNGERLPINVVNRGYQAQQNSDAPAIRQPGGSLSHQYGNASPL